MSANKAEMFQKVIDNDRREIKVLRKALWSELYNHIIRSPHPTLLELLTILKSVNDRTFKSGDIYSVTNGLNQAKVKFLVSSQHSWLRSPVRRFLGTDMLRVLTNGTWYNLWEPLRDASTTVG